MKLDSLQLLRCPLTGGRLTLEQPDYYGDRIRSGWLVSENEKNRFPIRDFIPRFVTESNYADSFGIQWNKFRKTQLDSYSGQPISANRFWKSTAWNPEELRDKWILDVGCGAGRFAEVALQAGAKVVALDYSNAVDACFENLRSFDNFLAVQGDIYALPFVKGCFSYVYSLGVLQHTPDVGKAFAALPVMVGPGGRLCADFYQKSWKSLMHLKYWLRPITKRISKPKLFEAIEFMVPKLFPVSSVLCKVPVIGHHLRNIIPIANYTGLLPLNKKQHLEWSILDTFDWLSPEFDNPQTPKTISNLMRFTGVEQIEVIKAGHLVARGVISNSHRN
jgi:2-polyprenyl-3-methyl-5-hydroxy-6-metoxy-1,4-benzoquinol methylase